MRERDVEQSGRHLTHTQWNMHAAERKQFIEERSKYEAQIREANEMLEKIAREARKQEPIRGGSNNSVFVEVSLLIGS